METIDRRTIRTPVVVLAISLVVSSGNAFADAIVAEKVLATPWGPVIAAGNTLSSQGPDGPGGTTVSGTETDDGTDSGTAAAGTNANGVATTPAQLTAAQKHAAEYNGPTKFTAVYTINLNADLTLNLVGSTVTFTTINFTDNNVLSTPPPAHSFITQPIQITSVTYNDDSSIASFSFSSTKWYSSDPYNGGDGLNDNGLSGTINLNTHDAKYTASYISKNTGAVYTYVVAAPEPASILLLLGGFVGLVLAKHRVTFSPLRRI